MESISFYYFQKYIHTYILSLHSKNILMRSFASDNNSGIHPSVIKAIKDANTDHAIAYGDDPWTEKAISLIKETFGEKADPYFVFNGTGANTVALRACTHSFNSIIAAESAHIVVDECGAPVFQTGCQIATIPTGDGKLTPQLIIPKLTNFGEVHHSQPKVVYISQCSELGTVYTPDEVKALSQLLHKYDMYLHMDGARLANACASLNTSMKELTIDCGVDILSFGGTKNGMMTGEAVISFRPELSHNLQYYRKQSAQLCSKMRYLSCQYIPYLETGLWKENAIHANRMAQLLREGLKNTGIVKFTQPTDANIILVSMPRKIIDKLQQKYFFYIWNEQNNEARFVTSFDTTEKDICLFLKDFEEIVKEIMEK